MSLRILLAIAACGISIGVAMGCGTTPPSGFGDGTDAGAGGEGGNGDCPNDECFPLAEAGAGDVHQCVNLECQQVNCSNGSTTTVSGTVFAPNGTLPLYNVIVYVPNAPLDPISQGVTCDQCGVLSSGSPLVVTLTDAKGHFQLKNVPVGSNIPLVMQVGKWRRQISIPAVTQCVDTVVSQKSAGIENLTRLPKNQKEGSMPKVAITTGGCDQLACIMPKIGIDPIEYAPGPTNSAVKPKTAFSFYNGSGGNGPSGSPMATPFWNDTKQLSNFDIAIFSCECYEATPVTKDQTSWDAVLAYLNAGGRIFTTDFQYTWYKDSKDKNLNNPPWSWPGGAPFQGSPFTIDQSFPKGKALADWLYYVSGIAPYNSQVTGSPPIKGQFPVAVPFGNIASIDKKYGTNWATGSDNQPKFVTMNEPSSKPATQQCGKGVHLDAHISTGDIVNTSFPAGCSPTIKETELATVFFFFDLSSCIQNDTAPVIPPTPN